MKDRQLTALQVQTRVEKTPAIDSIWTRNCDNQNYRVVGYKEVNVHTDNPRIGVELVRFIKSRNEWAKTPQVFTYLQGEDQYDFFYNAFTYSGNFAK